MPSRLSRLFSGADLLMLAAVVFYSLNVVVVKVGLADIPPLLWATVRFVVGGVVLAAVVRAVRGPLVMPAPADRRRVAVAALLGITINQVAFTVALKYSSAVDVSLIVGSTPLMVAGYAALRHSERIGGRAWVGLLIGAVGLVMVVAVGGAHGAGSLAGDAIALGAPLSWSIYAANLGGMLRRYPALSLSAVITVAGALALVPFGIAEAIASPAHWTWKLVGLLAFSSLFAVAFCTVAVYIAIDRLGATRATAWTYLQPFLGAVMAFVILGDTLRPLQLLGGVVVVAGVLLGRAAMGRGTQVDPEAAAVAAAAAAQVAVVPSSRSCNSSDAEFMQ
ncbi:MAG TPA: DMT family transporter [Candidatus Dormibacteraeota bacterium]|nr:DMT family transporter [Candidatus Dormibacteraeota bacterium]